MGKWKEYNEKLNRVADILPYGGLVKDNVLRCKDDSFIGAIEFDEYIQPDMAVGPFPSFRRGWNIWTEHQHIPGRDRYIIYFSWNPFYRLGQIKNLLDKSNNAGDPAVYFQKKLEEFSLAVNQYVKGRILSYNEFLSALAFSVSFDTVAPPRPEVPMYIDYYLTKGITFLFRENDIVMNDKKLVVLTLPSFPQADIAREIYSAFSNERYRHVKRILFMNEKEYRMEMKEYMKLWCSGRNSIKKFIYNDIIQGEFHGLATENLIFVTDRDDEKLSDYIFRVMGILEIPYINERFNLKDVWWGSLPGLFRANINPPAVSIGNIYELLFPVNMEENDVST